MSLIHKYKEALKKIVSLKRLGINPYPEKFCKEQDICTALSEGVGNKIATAGRIVSIRSMGKLNFAHIQDHSGRIQIVLKHDVLGPESYQLWGKIFATGDFVGVKGEIFKTKAGEISILVRDYVFLGKALYPIPEKWRGLRDQELKYRQRYLDLIADSESIKKFKFRSNLIRVIREFYWENGFYEVETPILIHNATGAIANPYKTHNDALDMNLFLRISHELPLKELIIGGFDKIFELGKAFRNEGIDPSHLPEHTHLEHYAAYWNYQDNIDFTEKMFAYIFKHMHLTSKITLQEEGKIIDFSLPWPKYNFVELMKKETGINILKHKNRAELLEEVKARGFSFERMERMSGAGLIDNLFKKVVRPKITNPAFLCFYPTELQPLARRNDADQRLVDQFQLVINGWEVVKAYNELVDPEEQKRRFEEQLDNKRKGEEDIMEIDTEYIRAIRYGLPPVSGLGIGIDRLVALLYGKTNLRDVILFPLLK